VKNVTRQASLDLAKTEVFIQRQIISEWTQWSLQVKGMTDMELIVQKSHFSNKMDLVRYSSTPTICD
jgi:hypothetical protein